MLALLTVAHPFVDACSACVAIAGGLTPGRILAYNAIAFATQLPLGMLADSRPKCVRSMTLAGMALAAGAAIAAACGPCGWIALVTACAGNALFHLGAGKRILDDTDGRGGPIGLFVSTGALGLLAARLWMEHAPAAAPWGFAAAMVCISVAGGAVLPGVPGRCPGRPIAFASVSRPALLALFALVAWRSWAGLAAGRLSQDGGATAAALFAAAVAAWAGKAMGGYAGDRLGWKAVTAASVACSAILAFCRPFGATAGWLSLVFVAQLAAGPVMSALFRAAGRRSGAAFGANCLGLFAGSLP